MNILKNYSKENNNYIDCLIQCFKSSLIGMTKIWNICQTKRNPSLRKGMSAFCNYLATNTQVPPPPPPKSALWDHDIKGAGAQKCHNDGRYFSTQKEKKKHFLSWTTTCLMLCDETLKKSLECIFVGLPGCCNWPFQYTQKIYQNSFIGEIMDDKLSIMTMPLTWLGTSENKLQNGCS